MGSAQPERAVNRRPKPRARVAPPAVAVPRAPAASRSPAASSRASFDRPALARRLRAGLDELGLGGVPAEPLLDYLALLVKWNGVYNLTAIRDPEQMLTQHLLDSLAVVAPLAASLPQRDGSPAGRIVDVGSGAGLPGVVLAIAWPLAEVLLVEPVGKKAAFLQQCRSELGLTNLRVAADRVEALDDALRKPPPDLIVCRAFASLAAYVVAVERLAGPATVVAAMKGVLPTAEIAGLPSAWGVAAALPVHVPGLSAARHLLLLRRDAGGATAPSPAPEVGSGR